MAEIILHFDGTGRGLKEKGLEESTKKAGGYYLKLTLHGEPKSGVALRSYQ